MRNDVRSGCPVSLSLEIFGDRWTLLVLRDLMFGGPRHFRELLASEERISSNILTDRLAQLVEHGMVTRSGDPAHRQKVTYRLTEQSIALVPVFAQLGGWALEYLPVSRRLGVRMEVLHDGGPALWERFMDELREIHLGPSARRGPRPDGPTVQARLDAAYEQVVRAG